MKKLAGSGACGVRGLCLDLRAMAHFLFDRPPVVIVTAAVFHDDADIARIPRSVWSQLLLPEDAKATFSISRSAGSKAGSSGLPSIICRGMLDGDVSVAPIRSHVVFFTCLISYRARNFSSRDDGKPNTRIYFHLINPVLRAYSPPIPSQSSVLLRSQKSYSKQHRTTRTLLHLPTLLCWKTGF